MNLYLDGQGKLCVDIKDTGVGISGNYLSSLFDSYSQEENGFSRPYEGLGLGLAITKKLLELNNASITAKSTKGIGSVFTVCFEKQDEKISNASIIPPRLEPGTNSPLFTKTSVAHKQAILVVEDDDTNYLLIEKILSKEFTVTVAENAEVALELFNNQSFDLILMDIALQKEMNGLELSQVIRAGKKNPSIPIIAVTGYASPEDKERAMESGCNEFLSKPFEHAQLTNVVKMFIG